MTTELYATPKNLKVGDKFRLISFAGRNSYFGRPWEVVQVGEHYVDAWTVEAPFEQMTIMPYENMMVELLSRRESQEEGCAETPSKEDCFTETFLASPEKLKVGNQLKVVSDFVSEETRARTWEVLEVGRDFVRLQTVDAPVDILHIFWHALWEVQLVSNTGKAIVGEPKIEEKILLNAPANPAHRQGAMWDKLVHEAYEAGWAKVQRKYAAWPYEKTLSYRVNGDYVEVFFQPK